VLHEGKGIIFAAVVHTFSIGAEIKRYLVAMNVGNLPIAIFFSHLFKIKQGLLSQLIT